MTEVILRNRFSPPVNAVDVGLRWGRDGYTCVAVNRDPQIEAQLKAEERERQRKAGRPARSREPAQIAMSAGLFGVRRPIKAPSRDAPPTFVQDRVTLGDDLVAVALRGGLVVEIKGRLIDLWPGDEIRIPAGTSHMIGVMTSSTRWLYGLRPNLEE